MGLNMKDFASRFEGVANIVGSYIESSIKEKGAFESQVKSIVKGFEDYITQSIAEKIKESGEKQGLVNLKVKKLENFKGELPKYESALASGFDVRAQLSEALVLEPGQRILVPTGLSFEIPEGYEIQARPRSGWAIKEGIGLVNSPGTIDADYRGEVKIIIINLGQKDVVIEDQHRVAQLVLAPVVQAQFEEVEDLSETQRGEGGFGSTGKASADEVDEQDDSVH